MDYNRAVEGAGRGFSKNAYGQYLTHLLKNKEESINKYIMRSTILQIYALWVPAWLECQSRIKSRKI